MECNTNYTLTLENRCCSDKDFKTAKATCKNGEYANGLSHCCNLGEIYNTTNSACQAP